MTTNIMNYDPNLTLCGRVALQTVRLTFGLWTYRRQIEVQVGGNCTGLSVIDTAVESAYEQLLGDHPVACIEMTDAEGNTLSTCDDEERDYEWMKDMLVAAEITAIEPSSFGDGS